MNSMIAIETNILIVSADAPGTADMRRQEIERQWNDPARLSDGQRLDDLLDEISFVSGEPRPSREELHDRH
jgi:hypothetical protein